ncbi:hypothetical protein [Natrarchaeobius chitinivorans]|uniref:hypothetical protein n=1 Tax=Natrarchaeobius chitinivorans TaxID=1679083 RepID=UPI000F538BE4|nr:hypothetical protein [Natrarchaeobius chitinivorans]
MKRSMPSKNLRRTVLKSSEKVRKIESWLNNISFRPEKSNIERVLNTALNHGKAIDKDVEAQMTVESECEVLASESIVIAFGELV